MLMVDVMTSTWGVCQTELHVLLTSTSYIGPMVLLLSLWWFHSVVHASQGFTGFGGLLQFESKDSHLSDIGDSMPVNQVDCGEWMYCGKSISSGSPLIDYPPACLIILYHTSEVFLICQLVEEGDGDFSPRHGCFHNHHLTWFYQDTQEFTRAWAHMEQV